MWRDDFAHFFVGGEWIPAHGTVRARVISPTTEQPIAEFALADAHDVDRAVAAARRAFDDGAWSATSPEERAALISRLADAIEARTTEIAALITEEMGCPIAQSPTVQIGNAVAIMRAFVDTASAFEFRGERVYTGRRAMVVHEPVGVVAAVVPWNVPLCIAVQKIAPALIAGCTVVLKPAVETPLNAFWLADVMDELGFPPGVVNVVPADREVSEYLISHPGVDKVAFTGSTAAGRKIAAICGASLRRVTLELGGKSAAIILPDADLDAVFANLRMASLRNSGQICSLKTRIIVPQHREADVVDGLRSLVASMPVGDPREPSTAIGPMVSQRQRDRVRSYVEIGTAEGADLVVGGGEPAQSTGWFVTPTVFRNVEPRMRIAQEEIFGPVLSVMTYRGIDDAVGLANDSAYGLNGAVFTGDLDDGISVARRLRTGVVEVNGSSVCWVAPVGGFKASGLGRENGPEGLSEYTELKSIGLPV
jgi:aldehyde dehydrogenase (NAD+)